MLILEFASPCHVIAFREFDPRFHLRHRCLHEAPHVAVPDIALDRDEFAVVLAPDLRAAVGHADFGQRIQPDPASVRRADGYFPDPRGGGAAGLGQKHADAEPLFPFPVLGGAAAADRGLDDPLNVGHGQPVPGALGAVQFDEQVGHHAGSVDRWISHPADSLECNQDLGGLRLQDFVVLAEHFDDDLPADAADGFLDVVADRLGEIKQHAGDVGDNTAHGFYELDLGPSGRPPFLWVQVNERLALIGPDRVGAVLGAALFGQDTLDFRELR